MIINYKAHFLARTLDEARESATARWRAFLDDPEAGLPWSATLSVKDTGSELTREEGWKEIEVNVNYDYSTSDA